MRGSLVAQDFNLSSVGTACIILISKASLCLSLMWSVWTAYKNLESLWWTVYLIHITKADLKKKPDCTNISDPSFLTTGQRIKVLNVLSECFSLIFAGKKNFYILFKLLKYFMQHFLSLIICDHWTSPLCHDFICNHLLPLTCTGLHMNFVWTSFKVYMLKDFPWLEKLLSFPPIFQFKWVPWILSHSHPDLNQTHKTLFQFW